MRLPLTALLVPPEGEGVCLFKKAAPGTLPAVVALIGAGGKTSLLYALARLLAAAGKTVITTTTTHIRPPLPEQSPCLLVGESFSPRLLRRVLTDCRHLTLARARREDVDKLAGFAPERIAAFADTADVVLVEADGAAMRPLKAPAPHEPAVPPDTELCVAVLGLDGIDRPFLEAVHRPERAAALCGTTPDLPVLPEHMSHLALHPEGLFRTCPPKVRRVVLCHKADLPRTPEAAARAARNARRQYPETGVFWYMGSVREGWTTPL